MQRQTSGGYRDDERMWPGIQDETIDSMIRLEHALHHFISKLPVKPLGWSRSGQR